jgi:hypothetical protein
MLIKVGNRGYIEVKAVPGRVAETFMLSSWRKLEEKRSREVSFVACCRALPRIRDSTPSALPLSPVICVVNKSTQVNY